MHEQQCEDKLNIVLTHYCVITALSGLHRVTHHHFRVVVKTLGRSCRLGELKTWFAEERIYQWLRLLQKMLMMISRLGPYF